MSSAELLIGGVLPYLSALGFLAGVGYRLASWRRSKQPGLMTLYPTQGTRPFTLLKEALFFPNLHQGDRALWRLSWTFHAFLGLALLGHLRVATGLIDRLLGGVGLGASGVATLSAVAGGLAGVVLLLTALLLLGRRLWLPRAREISSFPDFFALILLLAVITSGDIMRLGGYHIDLAETRIWATSLLALSPVVPGNPAFLLHALCAEIFILYIAFSKLMHFGGFFFSLPLVRRSVP